jgi:hypothetical protein
VLALFFIAFASASFAQTVPDQASKVFSAVRTETAPQIDGDLSDPVWANAARISDYQEMSPIEYRPASERTEAYILFDDDALYVGFYVYDSKPDEINNNVLQADFSLGSDDKVNLIIDPFNNQRSGYQFQVNANGVRSESIYISGTRPSSSWEGLWNAAGKLVEDGWTAEMEIPFKSLSFDPNNSTWGFNVSRHLRREQSSMAWYSNNGSHHPATAGKMTGITGINQGVGLDVIPSFSGTSFEDKVVGSEESELQPSLDIFYKVTPQINLAVTLNTDFSATEADDNTLNNTRFRQYFEEKRGFFLNDFDAFNFGLKNQQLNGVESGNNALAFYSRRIGLSEDGTPVDIVGGIKLSGRVGATEFGVLMMRQDEFEVVDDNGTVTDVIDPTNALVARVSHNILAESKIGLIFTDGNPAENQSNSLYGFDFQYRDTDFYSGKSLDGIFLYQQTQDPDFSDNQGSMSAVISVSDQSGWQGGAQYFTIEENYNPGLGFTQRHDAELFSTHLSYTWLNDDSSWIQEITSTVETNRWNFLESGELDSDEVSWTVAEIQSQRGDVIELDISRERENVLPGQNPTGRLGFAIPAGVYSQNILRLGYEAPNYWDLTPAVSYRGGDFYSGSFHRLQPQLAWQANRHLLLNASYRLTQYSLPGEDTIYTREVDLEMNYAFNSKISLTSQIEYDNVRRELVFNNRLRWQIEPGQDIWVVFNQGMVDEDEDNKFAVENTAAAFKIRYTLRY